MNTLKQISVPDLGDVSITPQIPLAEYLHRLDETSARMAHEGLDVLVVYGDREHSANLNFLTGFDPRFEEAVLLLDAAGRRKLLVGNECLGYLPEAGLGIEVELFQEFSLMGQPRGDSRPLKAILADFGVESRKTVGCAGWKYFTGPNAGPAETAIEAPAYLVDILRELTGDKQHVRNAGAMFMDLETGLRTVNSPAQIARFEYAAIRTSTAIRNAQLAIREGVSEKELEHYYIDGGLTRTCHPMVGFGIKARRGLASPSDNTAKIGEAFTLALGLEGSLTCRAGMVAHGPEDVPLPLRDFYTAFYTNYFDVVSTWYETVRVGVSGGEVFAAAEGRRDRRLYTFCVNPGHLIHLDEWLHSPFVEGGQAVLRSGMMLQADIIPVSVGPFCTINAEDGVVLADDSLRGQLKSGYPEMWKRMEARRRFMTDQLGIKLHESVLPLGNIPGWLTPYALSPGQVLVKA